ncbi:MAG: heme A synthase, partial [Pseudomonadota bacterium]
VGLMHKAGVLRVQGNWLAGLAVLQLATGLSNVILGWPMVAALVHTAGAAALVIVFTWAIRESRVGASNLSGALMAARRIAA